MDNRCEYCHEDSDGGVLTIEKNGHAFVGYDVIGGKYKLFVDLGGYKRSAEINYCPMCGRKLNDGGT